MKSGFLTEMLSRGYLNQCTDFDRLDKICSSKKITAYIGFDSTAESLHVGSLLQIMILRLLQKYGHQPIILLGGGTTLIGDPSGKDSTRKILRQREIKKNITGIKKNFSKLMNFKKNKPIFVNNLDWLGKLKYIEFLRNIGAHFTINKMLTFDSVKVRLDRQQSLSYMEFNYMILQAYDFYQLNVKKNCILQLGGSDQWGNIVNGVELIRRVSKKDAFGLTSPLITLASGAKMGKTEKGAVWLNEKLFSPYDYWQFWRNTDDKDVKQFLKFFTDIDVEEIEKICQTETNINNLKILLANEATKILHGKQKSKESEKIASETFKLGKLSEKLPEIKIRNSDLKIGVPLINILLENSISNSKSEARRMIKGRGIKIENIIVNDENKKLNQLDFLNKKNLKLSFGKKRHFLIKII